MDKEIKNIYIVAKEIYDNYKSVNSFYNNLNAYFYDKNIYKLLEFSEEKLKNDWDINKEYFLNDFKKKFKDLSKKNKKQSKMIKKVYNQLNKIDIIMYNIKNFNEFSRMVRDIVIPVIEQEKEEFKKINNECEKYFIIQTNGKHKKIFYNTQKISEITELKSNYIDELFELYRGVYRYEKIEDDIYKKIFREKGTKGIRYLHQCKSKMFLKTDFLGEGKLRIFCPICQINYILYMKMDDEVIHLSRLYSRKKELKEESYLHKLGYSLENKKEIRMNALEMALLSGCLHGQEIISFIKYLIEYNGRRNNMENAKKRWQEDLEDFINLVYERYGIKLNNKYV